MTNITPMQATGTEHKRGYSYPTAACDWSPAQRRSYTFGIQHDAHVRVWHITSKLAASAHITTESLLADLRRQA